MTNSFALNIQHGEQVASAATAKKNGKRSAAAGLSELFSHIPQQTKLAAKSNTISFKKILEPAKAVSGVPVATVERAQKKDAKTTDNIICVPCPTASKPAEAGKQTEISKQAEVSKETRVSKQAKVSKQAEGSKLTKVSNHAEADKQTQVSMSIPDVKTSPSTNHISHKDSLPENSSLPNPNIKPTIDPRSPMHGTVPGKNDSGRTLITDGPKAKENAPAQKNKTIDQAPIELNTAPPKNVKVVRSQIESNAASNNSSVNSALTKLQVASAPIVPPPQAEAIPVLENKAKAPLAKNAATSTEKVRVSYQVLDTESNSKNAADKQAKVIQPRPDAAYYKQGRDLIADIVAAPAKSDTSTPAVSEQFAPPALVNVGAANTNTPAATGNSVANVHEQVVSVAAAASYKIGQKIAVNLNPPELGRISIKFEKNGDEVIGRVEVEKSQTKNQIDLNLSQIVQNLQDSGVQLKRLEVVLQEQSLENQQEFAGHTQSDWDQNPHFDAEKNYPDSHSPLSAIDQSSYGTQSNAYFTDKSVNMLV